MKPSTLPVDLSAPAAEDRSRPRPVASQRPRQVPAGPLADRSDHLKAIRPQWPYACGWSAVNERAFLLDGQSTNGQLTNGQSPLNGDLNGHGGIVADTGPGSDVGVSGISPAVTRPAAEIGSRTRQATRAGLSFFDKCRAYDVPAKIKAAGVWTYFRAIESAQDPEVYIDGHKLVMLGSNNYLGLTTHPKVKEAAIDAVRQVRHRLRRQPVPQRHDEDPRGAGGEARRLHGHRRRPSRSRPGSR